MGEATYHFVAKFKNKKEAIIGGKKIKNWLIENRKASDYWQEHRDGKKRSMVNEVLSKFPEIAKDVRYVLPKSTSFPVGNGNELARFLINYDTEADFYDFYVSGSEVIYTQEVWHLSTWDTLIHYARSIGAVSTGFGSEEF